jgi:phenylacetate-coenzyme A ligase PaaK-like adenylate-forming protein
MRLYSVLRSAYWALTGYPADSCARLLSVSEHWSRQEIESYRDEKLRKLIAHCYQNVPYYRRIMNQHRLQPKDIRSAEDLVKLPILTRDVVRSSSRELLAANISEMKVGWSKTGGTTGEPAQICLDEKGGAWHTMCYERGLSWGGLSPDEPRIQLMGGSLGIDKKRWTAPIRNIVRRDLFFPAFELRRDTVQPFLDQIRRREYRFLLGYASSIYRLAVLSKETNREIGFDAVFPTAELMLPEWEEVIRKVFNCAVLPYYGCGEVQSLGFCRLDTTGYLIPEEHVIIEVARRDGLGQLFGEGKFLITNLDNYAMPIVRYENGDAGKVSLCTNGDPAFTRIERLDGRYNSFLMNDTGDLISGVIGTHVFRHVQSVESYRIIQVEPLLVTIKVVPRPHFSDSDRRLIITLFQKHLGPKMKIQIDKVATIPSPPSGKSIFVINHCLAKQ